MIYRLEMENFYSIRERQVIDLRVAAGVPDDPARFVPIYPGSKDRVPKIISLFGANGSGKSNVLRALSYIFWFWENSLLALAPDENQPCERFLTEETANLPVQLTLYFTAPVDLSAPEGATVSHCRYAYELALNNINGHPRDVQSESLRYWPKETGKPIRLFKRDGEGKVDGNGFFLASYKQIIDKLRPNASLISLLAQFEHAPSLFLRDLAQTTGTNLLKEKYEYDETKLIKFYAENPVLLKDLNREIERIDLGIRAVEVQKSATGLLAQFFHNGLTTSLYLNQESHGTRQFLKIFPLLSLVLKLGSPCIIDELDIAIHPSVLPHIIGWFFNPERNPLNAQLWMTCQNASLLEFLQKEEIFFCEKNTQGSTKVYALQEIQNVRRSENYYKKYLGGVYGAVPQIG